MFRLWVWIIVLVLAGCGAGDGGGIASTPANSAAVATAGKTQVTISLGQSVAAGAISAPGVIPAGVQSMQVTARDVNGTVIAGPAIADVPTLTVTLSVPNGTGITFEIFAFDAFNAGGRKIYEGLSAPQDLAGTDVVVPVTMNLAVFVGATLNASDPVTGVVIVDLYGLVAGAIPPATSPLLWTATGGTLGTPTANGAGIQWTSPQKAGTYTITANVDTTVNPDQNPAINDVAVITVIDGIKPVITMLGTSPYTIQTGTAYIDAGATASDNFDGDITNSIVKTGAVNTLVPGIYTVTYNVSDAAGNAAVSVIRTVNVVDTTAPAFSNALADIYVEATGITTPYTFIAPSVTDTYGVASITPSNVGPFPVGLTVVIWTATDNAGNISTATQNVVITDTTVPTLSLTGTDPYTLEVGQTYVDAGATFSDLVDGTGAVTAVGTVSTTAPATVVLTYDYTDTAGNAAIQLTRTVNVVDTTAPAFSNALADIYVEATGITTPYTFIAPTVTDSYGVASIIPSNSGPFPVGLTAVIWTATDNAGNISTATQNVVITDTTAPVITLIGMDPYTLNVGQTYIDAGATFTDLVDGTGAVTAVGTVTTTAPNTVLLTYDYTDAAGNAAVTITRTVDVTTPSADIALTHSVSKAAPLAGEQVIFTITATNNGPNDATGVVVTNDIYTNVPASMSFDTYTVTQGLFDAATGVWNLGTLVNGTTATMDIYATPVVTTPIVSVSYTL